MNIETLRCDCFRFQFSGMNIGIRVYLEHEQAGEIKKQTLYEKAGGST